MGQAKSTIATTRERDIRNHVEDFHPCERDVGNVLDALTHFLPSELAISIINHAEYWPVDSTASNRHWSVAAGRDGSMSTLSILLSRPVRDGAGDRPVRKVTVTISSRDQGYSSFPQYHGTRTNSSSWFELALVRPTIEPGGGASVEKVEQVPLFNNVHASSDFSTHSVDLRPGCALVDEAEPGDRFVLYAKAQYPQWVNNVRSCQIDVYVAVV